VTIRQFSQGTPTSASQVPFYDPENGCDRRASLAEFATALSSLLAGAGGGFVTQYAAPNASGFSVTVVPPAEGASVFLLLSPGGAYAAGTIVLPSATDGQEVLVHSRQAVTTLTVSGTASGAPTTIAAGGFFRMRFDGVLGLWCRVG